MVPQRHIDELAKALPNLDLMQGYLVPKDADPNLPLDATRAGRGSRHNLRLDAGWRAAGVRASCSTLKQLVQGLSGSASANELLFLVKFQSVFSEQSTKGSKKEVGDELYAVRAGLLGVGLAQSPPLVGVLGGVSLNATNRGVEDEPCCKRFGGSRVLGAGALAAVPAGAQSFGTAKEKVALQRKLPALVHLPGDTIKVTVTGDDDQRRPSLRFAGAA